MRQASDYALEHMADHLHAAGQQDRLHRLLVANRAWMDAKFERTASHAPFVGDLETARQDFADPLDCESLCRLLEIHTARLVLDARVVLDTDIDLSILTLIGREREALAEARLRSDPHKRFEGIARIERLMRGGGRPDPALLDELAGTIREIRIDWEKGYAGASLAAALRESGYAAEARKLAFSIEHPVARRQALSAVLDAAIAESERDDEALAGVIESARQAEDDYTRAGALGDAMVLLNRLHDGEAAAALLDECVAVIKTITRADRWSWCVRDLSINLARAGRFDEAIEQAAVIEDQTQIGITLERIGGLLFDAGDRNRAIEIVGRVPAPGKRSDALTALAVRLIEKGEANAATALLSKAEAVAAELPDASKRAFPWSQLSGAWERAGRREDADRCLALAWTYAEAVDERSIDHERFAIARVLAETGRFTEARATLDRLKPESRRYLLRDIAQAMAKRGDIQAASAVFEEARAAAAALRSDYDAETVRQVLADVMARVGGFDHAARVVRLMIDPSRRAASEGKLADALLAAGRPDEAIAIATAITDASVRDQALARLVGAANVVGIARAAPLVDLIGDAKRQADASLTLVHALVHAGDIDRALALAAKFQGTHQQISPVGAIAVSLVKAGAVDRGLGIARDMEEGRKRWWALRESAQALAGLGRTADALAVARSIPDEGVREVGFSSIASTLVDAAQIDEGLSVAGQMSWSRYRAEVVQRAVTAWLREKRVDEAKALACTIPRDLTDATNQPLRDRAIAQVVSALAEAGQDADASALVDQIESAAAREGVLRARDENDTTLTDRTKALATTGQVDAALGVAARIKDERNRGYAELEIVRALASVDRVADARAIAERIDSDPERAKAFYTMSKALVERRRFDEALRLTADNPGGWERGAARVEIAAALARERRFVEAVGATGITSVDGFIERVAEWAGTIDAAHPGSVPIVLRRVLRIAAWAEPDWEAAAAALD